MTSRFLALCRTSRLAAHPSPGNTSLSAAVKGRIRPCLRPRNRKRCVGPTVLSQGAPLSLKPPGRLLEARPHQAGPPTWWPLVRTRGQTWKTMPLGLGGAPQGPWRNPEGTGSGPGFALTSWVTLGRWPASQGLHFPSGHGEAGGAKDAVWVRKPRLASHTASAGPSLSFAICLANRMEQLGSRASLDRMDKKVLLA